jgi:two-component system, response regulator, stage 0 sporulation protein F
LGSTAMVASAAQLERPASFRLVLSGEAGDYVEALDRIVGPGLIQTFRVERPNEVLAIVRAGLGDAVVLDQESMRMDPLRLLRSIRRVNQAMQVVILTGRMVDRRWLEEALRLAAFSVVAKPLGLEQLLFQVHRMMQRTDIDLRQRLR